MKRNKAGGFTVVEALITVAAVAVIASVVLVATGNIQEKVRHEKLLRDVRALNTAIQVYQVNGGVIADTMTPSGIVNKLKTTTSDLTADTMVGLSGRYVDSQLNVEYMPLDERINTTNPRAIWSNADKRFVIKYDNSVPGAAAVRRFTVEKTHSWTGWINDFWSGRQEVRQVEGDAVQYAAAGNWVWDYEDTTQAAPAAPTSVPLNVGTSPATPGAPPGTSPLTPPGFTLPGGKYPLASYDKSLKFTNPNNPAVSEILYSIVLGSWVVYDGTPVVVSPGAKITAYARSTDPANWTDSAYVDQKYSMDPIVLEVAITVPKSLNYAEVGGAMMPGGPAATLASPGTITLANAADIPDEYENNGTFNVFWTYDGTDPLNPGDETINGGGPSSVHGGDPFSGGFPGQTVDLLLPNWGAQSSLPIQVAARGFNPDIFETSAVVDQTVKIDEIHLRKPLISDVAGIVTIDLETASGDMPEGARIYYTTDGADPGDDAFGNPIAGTEYTGPFSVIGLGSKPEVTVKARVYGPLGYQQWFKVSGSESEKVAVPPASMSFSHSASLSAP